jgi:hypothetical protein
VSLLFPPTAPPPLPNVGEAVIFRETTMIRRRMLDDDRNLGCASLMSMTTLGASLAAGNSFILILVEHVSFRVNLDFIERAYLQNVRLDF